MQQSEIYLKGVRQGQSLVNHNVHSIDLEQVESWTSFHDSIMSIVWEAQDIYQQYSPFEFFAHELNESDDPESAWELYESGIHDGAAHQSFEFFSNHLPHLEQPDKATYTTY